MGSIRKAPRTGRWEARYRDPAGRQRTRTFDRSGEARAWLTAAEADMGRGSWVDPTYGRRLFGEYALDWQACQIHRGTTAAKVASHMRRHILPAFGERTLESVRPSEVQAWVKRLGASMAPASVEVVYRYLATIFRAAVNDGLIARSPCREIKLPRAARREVQPLATDAVQALIAAMPERYRALVVTAVGTGLRQGELFGLTVSAVDFLRRQVRVERQLVLLDGRTTFGPPKTSASVRTVPLPDVVLDALARHLEVYPVGDLALVFTNDRSEPIRRNRFAEVWNSAARRAGVDGAHFHDCRHYYASLLIRHGESIKVVQARLGHASASETLDTYSHLWPDAEDRTRVAVDSVLGATRGADVVHSHDSGP